MGVNMGREAAGPAGLDEYSGLGEVLHAAGRGAVVLSEMRRHAQR